MGTYTAQILVGHSHLYHGGIIPSHALFLSENGRSAWCLYPILEKLPEDFEASSKIWICKPSTLIEDAMIMIALFIRKDETLITLVKKINKKLLIEKHIEFTEILSRRQREILYERSRELDWSGLKIAISIFGGSSIRNLSQLESYKNLEFEACVSFYEKVYNPFSQKFEFTDKLKTSLFSSYLQHLKGERHAP